MHPKDHKLMKIFLSVVVCITNDSVRHIGCTGYCFYLKENSVKKHKSVMISLDRITDMYARHFIFLLPQYMIYANVFLVSWIILSLPIFGDVFYQSTFSSLFANNYLKIDLLLFLHIKLLLRFLNSSYKELK